MTDDTIHTCSYSCERPGCIRAQRDELAARLTAAQQPAAPSEEAAVFDANFLRHIASVCRAAYDLCQPKPQRTPEDVREYNGGLCLSELANIADEIERRLAAAKGTHAGDGCHCATCTCNPNMTPAVRFDLSPAQQEGAIREHLIRLGWTPPDELAQSQQPEARGGGEAARPSATTGVDFAAVASIIRRAMRDGVHYGYKRDFILQQALALEALSQQPAAVGMTKLELFTIAAMHTLRAGDYAKWEHLAQDAVSLADATLAALAAEQQEPKS